jgi:hypothetical protein
MIESRKKKDPKTNLANFIKSYCGVWPIKRLKPTNQNVGFGRS